MRVKGVDWMMQKKERRRNQGKEVKNDDKYSGRKRSVGF
jgi:18S rRNA (guanine1575-N7)-methyltransferase